MTVSSQPRQHPPSVLGIFSTKFASVIEEHNKVVDNMKFVLEYLESAAVDAEEHYASVLKYAEEEESGSSQNQRDDANTHGADDDDDDDEIRNRRRKNSSNNKGKSSMVVYDKDKHEEVMNHLIERYQNMLDLRQRVFIQKEVIEKMKTNLLANRKSDGEALPPARSFMDDDEEGAKGRSNDVEDDFEKVFEADVQRRMKKYMAKSEEQRYHDDEDYIRFRKLIWEVNHTEVGFNVSFLLRQHAGSIWCTK
jgi:hypothetical protein